MEDHTSFSNMLIACDLDRTLLPNGDEPDDGSLEMFYQLLEKTNHTLVYVTGRNLSLVLEAKDTYNLNIPDYLIGDVGTTIYKKDTAGELVPSEGWKEYLSEKTPRWDWGTIVNKIPQSPTLYLQETWRQNPYKCSYYIYKENKEHIQDTLEHMHAVLKELNIDAQVIYSEDPLKHIGLIDILPEPATKLTALQYLSRELNLSWEEDVIYCGDSGNDILPLTSGCKAVLVKNAHENVKRHVLEIVQKKDTKEHMYIATGNSSTNGNYASGVIEGLRYFNVI